MSSSHPNAHGLTDPGIAKETFDAIGGGEPPRMRRDIVWNLASFALIAVAGLALNFAIGRVYGPAALGIFNIVLAIYTVASQFSVLGIQFALLRRLPLALHREGANSRALGAIVSDGLAIVFVSSAIVCAVIVLLAPLFERIFDSRDVSFGVLLVAPGLMFFSFNKALLAALNALGHLRLLAVMQGTRYVLIMIFLVLWVSRGWSAESLPALFTCTELLLSCALFPLVWRYAPLCLPSLRSPSIRELHRFGLKALWGAAVVELNAKVDILILALFASPSVVGIYSIAALIYEGLLQLPLVVRNVINPRLAILAHPEQQDDLTAFLRPVKRWTFVMMAIVALIAIGIYPTFSDLVLGDAAYRQAWLPLAILVVGTAMASPYLPLDMLLSQGGEPSAQSIQKFAVVAINIALNLAFVPFLGATGSALGTALAGLAGALLTVSLARRYLRVAV